MGASIIYLAAGRPAGIIIFIGQLELVIMVVVFRLPTGHLENKLWPARW